MTSEEPTKEELDRMFWETKYERVPRHLRPKNPCRYCGLWPRYEDGLFHHVCDTVASHLQLEDWDAFNEVDP